MVTESLSFWSTDYSLPQTALLLKAFWLAVLLMQNAEVLLQTQCRCVKCLKCGALVMEHSQAAGNMSVFLIFYRIATSDTLFVKDVVGASTGQKAKRSNPPVTYG